MTATTLDLRYRTHDILSSLDRGESIVITFRGKAKGIIEPFREDKAVAEKPSVENHPFVGMWAADGSSVEDEMTRLRGGRYNAL